MTVEDFEDFCWKTDGIRVVVRALSGESVTGFKRTNAVNKSKKISDYWDDIASVIGNREFVILNGRGELPHGNTMVGTVRETYDHD